MNSEQLRIVRAVMTITLVAVFVWSLIIGNVVIAIIAVIMATSIMYLLRRRVNEVVLDERVVTIGEKASRRSVQIFAFFAATVGIILISLSQSGHSEFGQIGFTLAFSASSLALLYYVLYRYYAKKMGD